MEGALSDLAQGRNFATIFSGDLSRNQMEERTAEDAPSQAVCDETGYFRPGEARGGWEWG